MQTFFGVWGYLLSSHRTYLVLLWGCCITGLGMNEAELQRNPVLTDFTVHDLNVDPKLPYPDNTFDVVTNAVSVDYLTKPIEVCSWHPANICRACCCMCRLQDVGRRLLVGACCAVTCNRVVWSSCVLLFVQVFKEIHRVLKPGGRAIMSFSNRCFPTKGEWHEGVT